MQALDFVLGQQDRSLSMSMASSLLSRAGDLPTKQVSPSAEDKYYLKRIFRRVILTYQSIRQLNHLSRKVIR